MSTVERVAGINGTFSYALSQVPSSPPELTIFSDIARTIVAVPPAALTPTANPAVFTAAYPASLAAGTYYLSFSTVFTSGQPAAIDQNDELVLSMPTGSVEPGWPTVENLGDWMGTPISAEGTPRAEAILSAVIALVQGEARRTWEDEEVPAAVAAIVVDVAAHIWRNPAAVRQQATGPFSVSYAVVQGLSLTADQKATLRRLRGAASHGLWVMGTTRNDAAADTEYVPVVGTTTEFPWYSSSEQLL